MLTVEQNKSSFQKVGQKLWSTMPWWSRYKKANPKPSCVAQPEQGKVEENKWSLLMDRVHCGSCQTRNRFFRKVSFIVKCSVVLFSFVTALKRIFCRKILQDSISRIHNMHRLVHANPSRWSSHYAEFVTAQFKWANMSLKRKYLSWQSLSPQCLLGVYPDFRVFTSIHSVLVLTDVSCEFGPRSWWVDEMTARHLLSFLSFRNWFNCRKSRHKKVDT